MVLETLLHTAQEAGDILAQDPPNPNATPIPGMTAAANLFIGWLKWVLIVGGVGGLIICGIMMAVGRRNRSSFAADGAAGIPWVLGGLALGAVAATIVGTVLK